MHNIKQNKPRKDSRYNQTYINPSSCKKLFESQKHQPIICRSSWEKKFVMWCESSSKVKSWGSECVGIKYVCALDKKEHTYYPDFCVETIDGEKWIVEIKPYYQTQPPKTDSAWLKEQYIKNVSKWKAVQEQCIPKGYKFFILTEKTIDRMI